MYLYTLRPRIQDPSFTTPCSVKTLKTDKRTLVTASLVCPKSATRYSLLQFIIDMNIEEEELEY